ncbi:right-handed parallel beta-helix repeat-containing protein [Geminicoccus roseus]|uniref:right-handed parallel beta-helix repeat-containing protein n=1 Tax=Geminicoccus roseus TaxID=404900 RepID=UPI00041B3304|nr:right-handed parallel beta-helix repeat-containing protein [Geminicoccus roseus]
MRSTRRLFAATMLLAAFAVAGCATSPLESIGDQVLAPAPIEYVPVDWSSPAERTLFASPAGTGSGASLEAPAALNTLLSSLQPGDRVLLLPGSYPSAKVVAKGTSAAPIRIEALHPVVTGPGLKLAATDRAVFRNTELKVTGSAFLRVQGIDFEVEPDQSGNGLTVRGSHDLAFVQNRFFQQSNTGLLLNGQPGADIRQVLVENNVFQNMIVEGEAGGIGAVRMDYGLRVHGGDTLVIRGNLFEGYFNHSLSLKEKTANVVIEKNRFELCGLVCIEGGQEPDTAHADVVTERTIANIVVADNSFDGLDDGTVGVFARNVERIFVTGNRFAGISEPLRVANNDRNSKNCARQLYLVGRTFGGCEPDSRLTQIGVGNRSVLFRSNQVEGDARLLVAGRGYPDDVLVVSDSSATGRVDICLRPFILNEAGFNRWTEGLPAVAEPPRLVLDRSPGFVVGPEPCLGKDLTHACEADQSCSRMND